MLLKQEEKSIFTITFCGRCSL